MMASAGNKSVISNDMQELNQGQEDVSKTIQGHKANLSNPSKTTNGITHSFHIKSQSLKHRPRRYKRSQQEAQR